LADRVVILFEEVGLGPTHIMRLAGALARLPPMSWLERSIASLPPRAALALVLAPTLLLLPMKLVALCADRSEAMSCPVC